MFCLSDIPTAVSFPHFYNSDPSLLLGVDGLKPDAKKHSSEIIFQPVNIYFIYISFYCNKYISSIPRDKQY